MANQQAFWAILVVAGAIVTSIDWKSILARRTGRVLDRCFSPQKAYSKAKQHGKFIELSIMKKMTISTMPIILDKLS